VREIILVVLVLVLVCSTCLLGRLFMVGPSRPPPAVEPAITVSAATLHAAYESNAVAADATYRGNGLRVAGRVDDIGRGLTGAPYITLAPGVLCYIDKSQTAGVAKLKKGDSVMVVGRCTGKTVVNMMVENCRLVNP
jgi:tRNA_anti-like